MTHPDHDVAATTIGKPAATRAVSSSDTGIDTDPAVDVGWLAFDLDPDEYDWFRLGDEPR